jgi:hypothetical protein
MRDDELRSALADLGDHIDYPHTADLSGAVISRLRAGDAGRAEPHRRVRALAVAAAVLVVGVVALPAPRHAVADWLGIGGVDVVRVDAIPPNLSTTFQLGREVSVAEAQQIAPFTVMQPSALGPADKVYAGEPSAESVSLAWRPDDQLPEIRDTGVGLLLTEIPATIDQTLLQKRLDASTKVEIVTVGAEPAYWISGGQHELLYLNPDGTVRNDTTRLSANTLVWSSGGVTFRMESNLDRAAAISLASHLEPL